MAKPLSEFGGWLKVFYITSWIGLFLLVYFMLMLLPMLSHRHRADVFYALAFLIDCGLRGFLGYKVIQVTKKPEAATPNRIIRLLTFILLVSCLFAVPKIYFAGLVYGAVGVRGIVSAVIMIIIWFLVCTTYFRESKRVLAFYGKNADKFF